MKRMSPVPRPTLRLAAALFFAAAASAQADPAPRWFHSELEAVVAAAQHYNARSIREDREFLGAILSDGDSYTFTVGAGRPRQDRITLRIEIPAGTEVVAFWHTHGAQRSSNRYFSAVDTALVERSQKPFYLADFTGMLKVMTPGAKTLSGPRARRLGLPARSGYAKGAVITDTAGQPIRIATRD